MGAIMTTDRGYPWLKFYPTLPEDPKYLRLSDSARARYFELYLLAGKADSGGLLTAGDEIANTEDLAIMLRQPVETLQSHIEELFKSGLVLREGDGLLIKRFQEEQGPSQTEKRDEWKKRQDKHRGKFKEQNEDLNKDKEKEEEKEVTQTSRVTHTTEPTSSSLSSQICNTCNKPVNFYNSDTASNEIIKIIKSEMGKSYPKDEQMIHTLAEKVTMQFESGCFCEVQRLSKLALHELFCEKCGGWKNQSNQDVFDLIYESIRSKFPDGDDELAQDTANQMVGEYNPWCPKCDTTDWLKSGLDWYDVLWEGQQKGEYPMCAFPDEFGRTEMYSGICRTE